MDMLTYEYIWPLLMQIIEPFGWVIAAGLAILIFATILSRVIERFG